MRQKNLPFRGAILCGLFLFVRAQGPVTAPFNARERADDQRERYHRRTDEEGQCPEFPGWTEAK